MKDSVFHWSIQTRTQKCFRFFCTHSDTVVVGVADHFILDLFPALQRFVHQHLGGVCEGGRDQRGELIFVVGEAGSQTTESEG